MQKRLILALWLLGGPVFADAAADKDFLTSWLESNLSGAGRTVTIDGFQGALSTKASLTQLTIADDAGIWLTLKDVTLDWSRSALLSGQIEISELSAAEIDLERIPPTQAAAASAPSMEAVPLALPDLPVSLAINGIAARKIVLGASVLGQKVEGSLAADLTLAGGDGAAHLSLERSGEGPDGHLALAVDYSNTSQVLNLTLDAAEGKGGVAASLLHVPGAPATSLKIGGSGPMSNFAATVNLSTDGTTRLAGTLTQTDDALGNRSFVADLAGDPTPVFLPDYAAFFGSDVALQAKGRRSAEGALVLDDLNVQAQALNLHGNMALGVDGQPERLSFTGALGLPDGPVTLPVASDTPIRLRRADLTLDYDAAQSDDWSFGATVSQLDSGALDAGLVRLTAKGRLRNLLFDGAARFSALSVAPTNAALARAIGPTLTGTADFSWDSDTSSLQIANLALTAPGYAIATRGSLGQMAAVSGRISGHYDDLSRLSGLMGQKLAGAARFDLTGEATPLTGAFDVTGSVLGSGLATGVAALDALLAGESRLQVSAKRDETGIVLRQVTVAAASLTADMSGHLASAGSDLTGSLRFADLSALGAGVRGGLDGKASFTGTAEAGEVVLDATGRDLGIGQAEADKLLRGVSSVSARLALTANGLRIDKADLATPQVKLSLSGTPSNLTLAGRLADLALLYPQFPGPVTISGTAKQGAAGTALDVAVKGPGQIDARVSGQVAADYAGGNLGISGSAMAALANPFLAPRSLDGALKFDLRLNGPWRLASLSGPMSIAGGRLADPAQSFALRDIAATARLGAGAAQVSGSAGVSTGGKITASGRIALEAPYAADLTIGLERVVLKDPQLYSTTASGEVGFRGPALGGALIAGSVALGKTELRIPSTGFGADGNLPGLKHVHDSAAVRATRARAGVDAVSAGGAGLGRAYGLNLRISAPNQVFVRGRGLDAELGGSLVLGGTTADIAPSGSFDLLRGRLDILGRRLVLSEAQLQMEGALVPHVHVVASVASDGVTTSVVIDGEATNPVVSFTSQPDLPQEEVLARLLFNRGLETISAFQAAQLAGAVATLAGRGGEGVLGALRQKTGLDNLDVQGDGAGNASVTAGKYFSDKTYSEVTVDQTGRSSISLNYDIAKHITLKAHVLSDGSAGAGVFLQRDY